MKKKIIAMLLSISTLFTFCAFGPIVDDDEIVNNSPIVEDTFTVERNMNFNDEKILDYSLIELDNLITEKKKVQEVAHTLAESARQLNWREESSPIQFAKIEWWNAQNAIDIYQYRYNELYEEINSKWTKKKAEYPAATEIWLYMKKLGWNDYVCAGILGNMMSEVGGQTLDIQYWLYGGNYYGICQWSKGYSQIWGADLPTQLNFLRDTIEYEFNTFGKLYYSGFNYNAFLNLTNEKEAAKAFAKCYERCGSASYTVRQKNATKAYNYFTSN